MHVKNLADFVLAVLAKTAMTQQLNTHAHTAVLWLSGFCPGLLR